MKNPLTHPQTTAGRLSALFAIALMFCANALAQNTWTNASGGNWTVGANWLQGSAPNSVGAIADFSQADILAPTDVHLDAPETVGTLIFGNATPENWTLDNNGNPADVLTLAPNSGFPAIIVTNTVTIAATLAGNQGLAIGGSGAGTLVLTSGSYSGQTIISNETVYLEANNVLSTNDLWLGGSAVSNGSVAILNLGTASQTVSNLVTAGTSLTAGGNTTAEIMVTNGQTLTVRGNALFGYLNAADAFTNTVIFTGGGNFVQQQSGPASPSVPMNFQVGACNLTSGQSGPRATVDMSGLASATINLGIDTNAASDFYPTAAASVAPAGILLVGDGMKSNAGGEFCTLLLASNTVVTANELCVGYERVQGIVETLVLGAGSNVFNVNTNAVSGPPGSGAREGGKMFFNTPTGSLKIRAQDGASRANLYVAAAQNGSPGLNLAGLPYNAGGYDGMTSPQYVDLSGHYADLLLGSLVIGDSKQGDSLYQLTTWTNYLKFDTGVMDVTGIRIGITTGTVDGTNYFQNSLYLNGGTVTVGTNGITMGQEVGFAAGTVASYTNDAYLDIGGGIVNVYGNIIAGYQNNTNSMTALYSTINITNGSVLVAGNIYCSRTTAILTNNIPIAYRVVTLNLSGGLLDMANHAIGSSPTGSIYTNNYIDQINLTGGTLQNVSQLNNGTVPLVMSGTGTLTLSGVNSYTGGTVVSNGTLVVNHDYALGSNNVTVASGATLQLGGGVANQYINPSASLIISPGANPVDLAYSGAANRISGLSFDGVTFQATGTWGSTASGATHQDNTHFSGTGTVEVTSGSSVSLTSSAPSATFGQSLVFTATVTVAAGIPTGTVTFYYGSTLLGTASLNGSDTASITNSVLPAGTDSITAVYSGDNSNSPATSPAFSQMVTVPAIALSGTNLALYYNGSIVGTNYILLTSTNLLLPLSAWTPIMTNAGTGGVLTFTVPNSATTPAQFFRYQLH